MTRSGVTAPQGWLASGVRAGTKPSGDLDLALVVSSEPATVAGAFTTNILVGAPIIASRPRVSTGRSRGVVVSAGIANVSTGRAGVEDAEAMASEAARACGMPPEEMLVSSTGVIGGRIPTDVVLPAIGEAASALSPDGGVDAAKAICTTDTRTKTAERTIAVGGRSVTIGAMAKGAGMIAPRMVPHATMLAFVTTDGAASPDDLRDVIAAGLPKTFNSITIDGSTSTSDMLLLFANGASGVDVGSSDAFRGAVHEVMADLAYQIVADGEGATKVIRIRVSGAATHADAERAARECSASLLLRGAIWGNDPNWGRVVQSIGQSGVGFDPNLALVRIGGVEVAREGVSTGREPEAAEKLDADEVLVEAELGLGEGSWEILTCDLTPEYVRFNADYTT